MSPKFDFFYSIIRNYNADHEDNTIDISMVEFNESAQASDVKEAAEYLISIAETSLEDCLDFQIYRNDSDDSFTADILITCGGPTVSLWYDSKTDALWFQYSAVSAKVEALISTERFSLGSDIASFICGYAAA